MAEEFRVRRKSEDYGVSTTLAPMRGHAQYVFAFVSIPPSATFLIRFFFSFDKLTQRLLSGYVLKLGSNVP